MPILLLNLVPAPQIHFLRQAAELAAELPEAELSIKLGRGDAAAHVYFSDLTHDYIRINAEYTT